MRLWQKRCGALLGRVISACLRPGDAILDHLAKVMFSGLLWYKVIIFPFVITVLWGDREAL